MQFKMFPIFREVGRSVINCQITSDLVTSRGQGSAVVITCAAAATLESSARPGPHPPSSQQRNNTLTYVSLWTVDTGEGVSDDRDLIPA